VTTTSNVCAWLIILSTASPAPHAAAFVTDEGPRAHGKIDVIFLSVEAANSRVTYREARTGGVKTSPVSSPDALEKLARFRQGQKVVFTYRVADDVSETVIEDVGTKANWWKRGAIIFGVVVIGLAVWISHIN